MQLSRTLLDHSQMYLEGTSKPVRFPAIAHQGQGSSVSTSFYTWSILPLSVEEHLQPTNEEHNPWISDVIYD